MNESALRESIQDSTLPHPEDRWGRIKYRIWQRVYPHYTDLRDALLELGIIYPRNSGRQPFVLGTLKKNIDIPAFLRHLQAQGFGNHFVAWQDESELAGLRKPDGFHFQYHLRIFKDGEVRGHYEYTPEAHPIKHLGYRHMRDRREDFQEFCGNWIEWS
ncbi:MAG TPA: hypothetical protein VHZ04_01190 [Candidatus Paceibacterota bacterium]|jgi:hypothetical protein|nr:hypothetical protein [Candidatus Paceibacterota bacterium]